MNKNNRPLWEWLFKARKDIISWKLLSVNEMTRETALFHAQQAVEKWLKALIVLNGQTVKRTHDLKVLLDSISAFYPAINSSLLIDAAIMLSNYAVYLRYKELEVPEEMLLQDMALAEEAIPIFENLVKSVVGEELFV